MHSHFWILLYEIDLYAVSYVFRAGQNIWYIEIDLCISLSAKAATVYDIINQTAIMLKEKEKPTTVVCKILDT